MRELDTPDDREGDEVVEEGHEAGGAKDEEGACRADSGGGNLGDSEVGCLGDGDGSDGFHGLDRHGDAEEEASEDIVDGSEDEGGAEVEVAGQSEG